MNTYKQKTVWRVLAMLLCLTTVLSVGSGLAVIAEEGSGDYVKPEFLVDFAVSNMVDKFPYFHNTAAIGQDGTARVYFAGDAETGLCDDPYFALPLPDGHIDLATYHYVAMLIKSNYTPDMGELRFETTDTAGSFPCQRFSYANTDDWQLIVVDLTDLGTLLFSNGAPVSGRLTHLRLDPFGNNGTEAVEYYIKAYGLYTTAEEAQTFANFKSDVVETDHTFQLPDIDYSKYWLGEAFANPDPSYRMGFVGYGYNELYEVDVDKLLEQGYNGIVSNVNFNQQYLRDDAEFDLLRRAYEYATTRGMNTWIYDEYQWPSGKAFGIVLEGHDEFEATGIEHREIVGDTSDVIYEISGVDIQIMAATLTDTTGVRNIPFSETALSATATGEWKLDVYVLRKTFEGEEDRTDYEKLRDVNLLDPGSVERFIEVTYVKYRDAFGDSFKLVEAFFTDEPQLGNRAMENYAVWSPGFAEMFREQFGYELNIASIFSGDTDMDKLTRLHYYQLVASLFKSSYVDQITEWCEANGTLSSGHFLFEENMNDQIETYGGDFLQLVGGMSMPGLDLLWVDPEHLMLDTNIGNFMGLRYVKSAAKNASKSDVMVEWNPCTTKTAQFMNDELNTSYGGAAITRLCGANVFQVIDPSRSYTYSEINALNLYIARMNTILDGQREMGDVAVFYPIATVQAYHDADSDHSSTTGGAAQTKSYILNSKYTQLCKELMQNQILFSIVDDQSLSAASVSEDGHMTVGEGVYKTIVVPYSEYMSVEAAESLDRFARAGGRVIFVETKPTHATEYGRDEELVAIMNRMPSEKRTGFDAGLLRDLIRNYNNLLTVSATNGILRDQLFYGDFTDDVHEISFLVNTAADDATLTFAYKDGYEGTYFVYYPGTAMIEEYQGEATVTVPRYQSVFVIRGGEEADPEIDSETVADETESSIEDTEMAILIDTVVDEEMSCGCKALVPSSSAVLLTLVGATVALRKRKKKHEDVL